MLKSKISFDPLTINVLLYIDTNHKSIDCWLHDENNLQTISYNWALSILPGNIRKPEVFCCFQGVLMLLYNRQLHDQWHDMG